MICPSCKKEIQDNTFKCPHCGLIVNAEEYRKQMNEYNRQMEEYNRQMAEYNRQMAIYRQQMNVQNGNHGGGQGMMPNSGYNQPQGMMPNSGYNQPQGAMPNSGYSQPKKKSNALLISMFSLAGILIIASIILVAVFLNKDKKPMKEKSTTEAASGKSTEVTTEGKTTEPATNEYNEDYADYTVMIYMIGSNLESGDFYENFGYYLQDGGNATYDLDQIAKADIGDNVNVILETGGTDYWANDYGMEGNHVQRFELSDHKYIEKEDLGDICMCHENVLEEFLVWGRENYPANKYIMIYWDHGCGLTTASFGSDTSKDENDVLQISDMTTAMKNSGIYFDITIFNACLMGSLEMASEISPYSEYMIASEEVIYTFGYYYTDWLTQLSANPKMSAYDLGTLIIDDFEEQYDYYNTYYSNSYDNSHVSNYYTYELALIDTSETVEVVDELSDMLESADEDLYDYKLTDFLTARSNCGDFSGTYSADIIEFCQNYKADGYEEVISKVEDSILYIKSNIPYANGLSFYCPEGTAEGCYSYSYDGRINLMGINYDEDCIKFYDDVLSAYAGYACSEDISKLGMDSYYNEQLVSAYDDTYTKYASSSEYNLDYVYENGKYILDLGADFDYVNFMEQRVGYDYTENTAVVLGSDFNVVKWNENGKVDVTFPEQWLCVDGQIVCYVVTDHVSYDDGSVAMTGVVPFIFVDDTSRLYGMIINWDSENGVTVKGYTEIDMETLSFVDSYTYSMYEGMEIKFCYGMVEHDGNQLKEETTEFTYLGDVHKYDGYGFSIEYADIDEFRPLLGEYEDTAKGYSYMKVYDIFGNEYTTDLVPEE
ncbi:MAG: hypothetical protein J6L77_07435 [Coprococcus sp.]|nr:hypothetical protein [Coprococcus sp.]